MAIEPCVHYRGGYYIDWANFAQFSPYPEVCNFCIQEERENMSKEYEVKTGAALERGLEEVRYYIQDGQGTFTREALIHWLLEEMPTANFADLEYGQIFRSDGISMIKVPDTYGDGVLGKAISINGELRHISGRTRVVLGYWVDGVFTPGEKK